ncbi:MAG: hypothetical protein ACOYME_03990 [Prochlorotrichaceae cyanobacterium]
MTVQLLLKRCRKPLKPNPFQVYRDPATGRWQVEKSVPKNHP